MVNRTIARDVGGGGGDLSQGLAHPESPTPNKHCTSLKRVQGFIAGSMMPTSETAAWEV